MKRHAVERVPVRVVVLVDLDAVGIVRADLVQRHEVRDHQEDERERQRRDVQREEAVERRIRDARSRRESTRPALPPITGRLPNSEVITCAPQKLMLPQGST